LAQNATYALFAQKPSIVSNLRNKTLTQPDTTFGESPGGGEGGRALPYMGYIGMCRCEGYGFQAVYSRIGYINQSVWV